MGWECIAARGVLKELDYISYIYASVKKMTSCIKEHRLAFASSLLRIQKQNQTELDQTLSIPTCSLEGEGSG